MSAGRHLEVIAVEGIPEVAAGARLADLLVDALSGEGGGPRLTEGDVIVVTSKVVSKAEGRVVRVDDDRPETVAALVEAESARILRRRGELFITETSHGFVCANAGVDRSNVPPGWAVLLPLDPDRSARRIRDGLRARTGLVVGVVVSDTFGRPWRHGVVDVAIGCAGVAAVVDLRGQPDSGGRPLSVTEVAVADELAAAAELVMGKAARTPAALVRGVDRSWLREASVRAELVRHPGEDLFR